MNDSLGFTYNPTLFQSVRSKVGRERACFRLQQRFPAYIWHDSATEGKPYTYPQIQTILDSSTVGGSRLNFEQDIINQKASLEKLIQIVRFGQFEISKGVFCSLHDLAAKEEALAWGVFRTGNVYIAGTDYSPADAAMLDGIFNRGAAYINSLGNTMEKAIVFFLFGALHQFFYDANKRTSRLMMNGCLLSAGWDALVVNEKKA